MADFAHAYFEAVRRTVEWCFVLDADEFLCIDHDLSLADLINMAEKADKDFITFQLSNATSVSGAEFSPDTDIYMHFRTVIGCAVPIVTKNAFRMSVNPQIAMGNHSLVLFRVEHGARLRRR